ncbi:putative Caspase-3 [Hypsibius exemplaris]|uniref:Caspase-3 n=1 Tax=Hypsibius exemplaris TaxID=2072580 RepID=A0A1W0WUY8_HYPEX|nr:putative Caspase-3 [Hypsibius exemplaris]
MSDHQGGSVLSTAWNYFGDLLKKRKGSNTSASDQRRSSMTTSHPAQNSPRKPAVGSAFDWKTSRTLEEPAQDLQDALPSPAVRTVLTPVPKTPAPVGLFSTRYFMGHAKRGTAVIINNRHFILSLGMPERKGTDEDAKALSGALKLLGFEVLQYDNLTVHNMAEAMKYFASLNHSDVDCFLTAVLTHGDEGVLFGTDGKMSIDRLLLPFKGNKCLTLAGKPKIFIFQACRGDKLDRGVDLVQADDESGVYRLPSEADFLLAYSTIPGFYSWRNTDNGSWYIQALAKTIHVHYGENRETDPRWEANMDFVKLLTRVNFEVSYFYKSNVPTNPELDQQKQVPSIVSMLTRDLYFPAKPPALLPPPQSASMESL